MTDTEESRAARLRSREAAYCRYADIAKWYDHWVWRLVDARRSVHSDGGSAHVATLADLGYRVLDTAPVETAVNCPGQLA